MIIRRLLPAGFLLIVFGLVFSALLERAAPRARSPVPAGAIALPVMFEPDATGTAFLAQARGYRMRVASGTATVRVRNAGNAGPVELRFDDGAGRVVPERPLGAVINYLQGPRETWRTGVPAYGAVRLEEVYDGIDAVFYGSDGDIEYDLVVAPGMDAGRIRLRFGGVDRIGLERGDLRLQTGRHTLTQRAPIAYQRIDGRNTPVAARYTLAADGAVGFALGEYDRNRPLVIDPTISYSTYFGATGVDGIHAVTTDASGNVYLAGRSQGSDFPLGGSGGSGWDTEYHAFVAKLRADGTPEWLNFLAGSGGDGVDTASAVATGPAGDVYVTGTGCGNGFPTTPGAYRGGTQHMCDVFVARFAPDGTLQYSTLLGAPSAWGPVGGSGIVVDSNGRAVVTGPTASPSFVPTIASSFGPQPPGLDQPDAFVARFSADGTSVDWSRLLAGSLHEHASAITMDQYGNHYVVGRTNSNDYPVRDAVKPQKLEPGDPDGESGYDGFLTQIWEDGQMGFSTYLGGSREDYMNTVVVGLYDRVYVGGTTNSPDASFYKPSAEGEFNGIIYQISRSTMVASRPVGGSGYTEVRSLAVGQDWSIWVAGSTDGQGWRFSAPDDPVPQRAPAGSLDMFVEKWSAELNGLYYSYLLGGTGHDFALGIALDPLGDIYVAGTSTSSDYPVKNAVQSSKKEPGTHWRDGVVTKFGCYLKAFLPVDTQPASGGEGFANTFAAGGCVVDAVSDSSWLRITGVSGNKVQFTTDPNPTSAERHATITLSGKKTAPVIQAAGAGSGGPAPADEIVLNARDVSGLWGGWDVLPDDVHGSILSQPDRGAPKIDTPSAFPSQWFTFTFTAEAGKPYHLWIHGRAQGDSWRNDSIYAQFSDSVDASGNPIYRIGTTSATWVSLEECSGCGEQGWGWQDNQYGARGDLGPDIYFGTSGTHTIKFQTREDGFDIGQVVLSARAYLRTAPGGNMNDPTIVTLGTAPPPEPQPIEEIVLWAANDAHLMSGAWRVIGDSTAAGQTAVWNPDSGTPKLETPHATPGSFFDINFNAEAGTPYHLWLRLKADADHWTNDSVWVQFSGSVDGSGNPVYRIDSASGTWVSLEECSGCGEQGWGWQDNAYGSAGNLGPPIYFAASGPQTIRIQNREDGVTIDQIVLSAGRYATSAPGSNKNDTTILPRTPK